MPSLPLLQQESETGEFRNRDIVEVNHHMFQQLKCVTLHIIGFLWHELEEGSECSLRLQNEVVCRVAAVDTVSERGGGLHVYTLHLVLDIHVLWCWGEP